MSDSGEAGSRLAEEVLSMNSVDSKPVDKELVVADDQLKQTTEVL